jgi:hypothetical protein
VRAICTVLGLEPDSQVESLQQHDVLAQGLRYVRIPLGNRFQTVLAIHRRYLYFWLASIRPSLVRPEVRPKLKAYQEELVELLIADICGVPLQAFALNDPASTSETASQAVQLQKPKTTTPSAASDEALALIKETLQARPDVVPFVLEMIAAFVEETPRP